MIRKTMQILMKHPLCYDCLGRQFSTILRGFTNYDRGKTLVTALMMELYARAKMGDQEALNKINQLNGRIDKEFQDTIQSLGIEYKEREKCWLCEDKIRKWVKLAYKIEEELIKSRTESFVVGVLAPKKLLEKEDELWREFSITTGESIRNQLKREVGKILQSRTGIPVDFENPGAIVYLDLFTDTIYLKINPLIITGNYLKLGRDISQAKWVTLDGVKVYKDSIEEFLYPIMEIVGGTQLVLHASGREDTDARMLGTGRPMVVEIKDPLKKKVNLKFLEEYVNKRTRWAKFTFKGIGNRNDVRRTKTSDALRKKVYKALVKSDLPISKKELILLEEFFQNRTINQKTPTRVLHRRADMVRKKNVYQAHTHFLNEYFFDAIILAEGGLYIKELISGDNGRTTPSFTEVLGKPLKCIELDVLSVEEVISS